MTQEFNQSFIKEKGVIVAERNFVTNLDFKILLNIFGVGPRHLPFQGAPPASFK